MDLLHFSIPFAIHHQSITQRRFMILFHHHYCLAPVNAIMLWTVIGSSIMVRHGTTRAFLPTLPTAASSMGPSLYSLLQQQPPPPLQQYPNQYGNTKRQYHCRRHYASTRPTATTTDTTATAPTVAVVPGVSPSSASVSASTPPRIKTVQIQVPTDHLVTIMGWVRTIRKQKNFAFLQVNDGSSLSGIQCVVNISSNNNDDNSDGDSTTTNSASDDILNGITTGAAVELQGTIVPSQGGKQSLELAVTSVKVVGTCPGETYPLAKKRHSLEYLRTIAHLRPRTNTIAAIARVRSKLAGAIHEFFQMNGVLLVHTPLITSSDCEGAGEMFRVTTFNIDVPDQLPILDASTTTNLTLSSSSSSNKINNNNSAMERKLDSSKDFFDKPAFLTVSGQLAAETYACALGDVYTFGPTFRAENSQTTRHLAEFHMVEPELAFCDLNGIMDNAERMLQFTVRRVLEQCREDMEFFNSFYDKGLLARLEKLVNEPFARISYTEAVGYLQEEISKDPSKWQFAKVEFGTDLATEHERWLAETKFKTAVFVYNYPKSIKAFYMRDNDDENTVAAMDLLVPGVGELIGGSQREDRLDVLEAKMKKLELNPDDYWWYLDLRRFGSVPHSGYGMGFERLVTYVCGMENIREAIAFPRYPGNAEF